MNYLMINLKYMKYLTVTTKTWLREIKKGFKWVKYNLITD